MELEINMGCLGDTFVDIEICPKSIKAIKKLAAKEEYVDAVIDNIILEEELPEVYAELHREIVSALQDQIDEFGHDAVAEEIDFWFELPEEF